MRLVFASIAVSLLGLSAMAADLQSLVNNSLSQRVPSLGLHFADSVEVRLPNEDDFYSAAEARAVFQGFLSQGQNWRFNVVHQGRSSSGSSEYYIGNLDGSPGKFRLYLYVETTSGPMRVTSLAIDFMD